MKLCGKTLNTVLSKGPAWFTVHSPCKLSTQSCLKHFLDWDFFHFAPSYCDSWIHVIYFTGAKCNSLIVLSILRFHFVLLNPFFEFSNLVWALFSCLWSAFLIRELNKDWISWQISSLKHFEHFDEQGKLLSLLINFLVSFLHRCFVTLGHCTLVIA